MLTITKAVKSAAFLPIICLSILCFSQPASFPADENGGVEFVKSEGGNIYFAIGLKNIPARGCQLRITDQFNEVIYENRISGATYQKTFKFPDYGMTKINFEVNGKQYQLYRSFDLSYKVETKLEVTRL